MIFKEFRRHPYKFASMVLFGVFIYTSFKYLRLKDAYQTAEAHKVRFCKENVELRREVTRANYEADKLLDKLIQYETE